MSPQAWIVSFARIGPVAHHPTVRHRVSIESSQGYVEVNSYIWELLRAISVYHRCSYMVPNCQFGR